MSKHTPELKPTFLADMARTLIRIDEITASDQPLNRRNLLVRDTLWAFSRRHSAERLRDAAWPPADLTGGGHFNPSGFATFARAMKKAQLGVSG